MEPSDLLDLGEEPSPLRPTAPVARRLIVATVAAIDAHGEAAVRVQDIADSVGVPIPMLYRHFGNRDGLMQAAHIERLAVALDTELQEIVAAFAAVDSAEAFRGVFDTVLDVITRPERHEARWKRVNVIGSTYGRPAMAAAVAQVTRASLASIAAVFARPQREGWLREGLDVEAFASWFSGQALGRVLIELGDTGVDTAAWNAISADAVRHVLFG